MFRIYSVKQKAYTKTVILNFGRNRNLTKLAPKIPAEGEFPYTFKKHSLQGQKTMLIRLVLNAINFNVVLTCAT